LEIRVPLERFLASRNWVAHTLITYHCDAVFDPAVQALLDRQQTERDEVLSAIARGLDELPSIPDIRTIPGSRFKRELKPFQLRDLARMLALSHGANFSVPGAGKTTVAYACYEAERLRHRVERLLVVAPISAFDAWTNEAIACMSPAPVVSRLDIRPRLRCEVLLVNYHRVAARYQQIAEWVSARPCHVILDEAHRIKRGRTGEWGTACLDLAYLGVRRDILTGTPAPQHPTDFIALMDFLWPHQATRILPPGVHQATPSSDTMLQISARLAPLFVRTRKDELGLDKPMLRVERVKMKPVQAQIYDAIRTRMRTELAASARDRVAFSEMKDVVVYLLEAATNPALLASAISGGVAAPTTWPPSPVPLGTALAERVINYGRYEMPRKFEKLAAMVADNASRGRKTLVWSNFVTNLQELSARVLLPFQPALIYGAIPTEEEDADFVTRESELRRFRDDPACKVLLANPAAMSEGVSLHESCHDAIYLERNFNAGQYLQSLDRIHRLGLPPGVETRITFLVSSDTIDEIVDQRVGAKAERLSQMLRDPNLVTMALPDEEAYGEWVDAEDLESLFAHLGRPVP